MDHETIISSVRQWLDGTVVELNLCPFARAPISEGRVRFIVSEAQRVELLLHQFVAELQLLDTSPEIETTLLIHPQVLQDFLVYNENLASFDELLYELGYEGIYQIASFHPDYQFAGTSSEDAENYSNRSPYPLLHLLRERSVEQAVASYADPERIPQRNIARLEELGTEHLARMLRRYR